MFRGSHEALSLNYPTRCNLFLAMEDSIDGMGCLLQTLFLTLLGDSILISFMYILGSFYSIAGFHTPLINGP